MRARASAMVGGRARGRGMKVFPSRCGRARPRQFHKNARNVAHPLKIILHKLFSRPPWLPRPRGNHMRPSAILPIALAALLVGVTVATPAMHVASADPTPPAEVDFGRVKALFTTAVPADIATWARTNGATVVLQSDELKLAAFQLDDNVDAEGFLALLRARSDVSWANYDGIVRATLTPNDPLWPQQYGPRLIGAPLAWNDNTGSSSVILAVLDTGVDATHEDLMAAATPYCVGTAGAVDGYGHGTHVAGIAAAQMNNLRGIAGVAQVKLACPEALTDAGSGWWSQLAVAILEASAVGSKVISMSLGGNCTFNGVLLCPEVQQAINIAWSRGAVLVAATGNDGFTNFVSHPASFNNVVAVGSVGSTKARSWFSNGGAQIDLVAPGDGVISTVPAVSLMCGVTGGYCSVSGTSMSTPHVSGVAALLFSDCPWLTNAQVVNAMTSTAENLGAAGWDNLYGHGLVRADLALATC